MSSHIVFSTMEFSACSKIKNLVANSAGPDSIHTWILKLYSTQQLAITLASYMNAGNIHSHLTTE